MRKTQLLLIKCLQRQKQKDVNCRTFHLRIWRLRVLSRKASVLVSCICSRSDAPRVQAHSDLTNSVLMQADGYQARGSLLY